MINIIKKRKIWFIASSVLVVLSILFFAFFRLNLGIDFTGGTLIEAKITDKKEVSQSRVEEVVKNTDIDLKTVKVQKTKKDLFLIKMDSLNQAEHKKVKQKLGKEFEKYKENKYESVGPTVGRDLRNKAVWAVILAAIAIILYIWWAFRRLPAEVSSFNFGLAAIIALIHDVIIVVGVFSLLGHFFTSLMVGSYFIVALLTVMGFSVHDTIVVFDRLRENLLKQGSGDFEKTANESVKQTIVRSINVSLTLVIVLLALMFFSQGSVQNFVLALLIGTIAGTYSSIFVASPLIAFWQAGKE